MAKLTVAQIAETIVRHVILPAPDGEAPPIIESQAQAAAAEIIAAGARPDEPTETSEADFAATQIKSWNEHAGMLETRAVALEEEARRCYAAAANIRRVAELVRKAVCV